jgi:osmoprotectant transport system permease protein
MRAIILALTLPMVAVCAAAADQGPIRIGSKRFTESYILGEIAVQSARRAGAKAVHKPGLGNTAILIQALAAGSIDAYPEYTGTIAREVLKSEEDLPLAALNERLKPIGLAASVPLGFSNSYALGVRDDFAASRTSRAFPSFASGSRTNSSGGATAGRD